MGLLLALFTATLAVAPAGPARAATTMKVATWNLQAGSTTYNATDMNGRLGTIGYLVDIENPYYVAFTEICEDVYNTLAANWYGLVGATSVGAYVDTAQNADGCEGDNDRGNAVFARGNYVPNSAFSHIMTPTSGETRRAVCFKVAGASYVWTACSAHLSNDPDVAEYQLQDGWDWWASVQTTPWMFGGDFNQVWNFDGNPGSGGDDEPGTNPEVKATDLWLYLFNEIHLRRPVNPATLPITFKPNSNKIDYIYGVGSHFSEGTLGTCHYSDLSDHRYCTGRFVG